MPRQHRHAHRTDRHADTGQHGRRVQRAADALFLHHHLGFGRRGLLFRHAPWSEDMAGQDVPRNLSQKIMGRFRGRLVDRAAGRLYPPPDRNDRFPRCTCTGDGQSHARYRRVRRPV